MSADLILKLSAVAAIIYAVTAGPLIILVRAHFRYAGQVAAMRRWQGAATLGIGAGLVGAVGLSAVASDGPATVMTAAMSLLILMASMDIAWRWLPLEWSLPFLGLGLINAVVAGTWPDALIGVVMGGGTLFVIQQVFRIWREKEALGTGDIWLAAGLGALAGPMQIGWILCLAALTALGHEVLSRKFQSHPARQRFGVAYGAHMIGAYLLIQLF